MHLLAYIDDATSRIQHAAFVPSESAFDYMRETQGPISSAMADRLFSIRTSMRFFASITPTPRAAAA
jgi:hypothetical protein